MANLVGGDKAIHEGVAQGVSALGGMHTDKQTRGILVTLMTVR